MLASLRVLLQRWREMLGDARTHTFIHFRLPSPISFSFFYARSGLLGENPRGTPNNLMPIIQQVLVGKRTHLSVFGSDYPTKDGTGVRDYIHVVDLARAHVCVTDAMLGERVADRVSVYNVGTGQGISVLELKQMMEEVSGKKIAVQMSERRPGDQAIVLANADKIKKELGWEPEFTPEQMCAHSWAFANDSLRE
mmetsp:Transcript_43002/g.111129  ORF Transcript_43002/g.111129 Transcript_43002/m.111129 type:complete len:195 (+) Transcript_43002:692-1276(+)